MSEPKVVTCPNCGQMTRVKPAAEGPPLPEMRPAAALAEAMNVNALRQWVQQRLPARSK